MRLSTLLHGIDCRREGGDPDITFLTCDSRQAGPGCLFAALPGAQADGADFIPRAAAAGAVAVLTQEPVSVPGAAVVLVPDARRALALLAAAFYGRPAQRLTLIGVTGTKGKTTTTHMLRSILEAAGCKTALAGTLGNFIGGEKAGESVNTTPESLELHRFFAQAAAAGCTHLVMEVSSQALKLERTWGICFDAALFLNLTPDHIGGAEHKDFQEYLACKSRLFRQCRAAAANCGDPHWEQVLSGCPVPVRTFGFEDRAQVRAWDVQPVRTAGLLGSRFFVSGFDQSLELLMPGVFNVSNALAAVTAAGMLGLPEHAVRQGLRTVSVPGRTQVYPHPGDYTVLIDYAHNGASFASLLTTLRGCVPGRIIAVFGAGGDRPRMRRTDMARQAARHADFAVLTADNPRSERVEDICADLAAALEERIPFVTIPDRTEAIRYALDMARPGDLVALLGKGHENYLEISGERIPFSETAVLDDYFNKQS